MAANKWRGPEMLQQIGKAKPSTDKHTNWKNV